MKMNFVKKLALPLFVAGSIGMSMPSAQAEPTIIPYQMAQADPNGMELQKSDLGNGDRNHSGVVDEKDDVGVRSLGDNTNDMADGNDSETNTFNATFWFLMALLSVGIVAMIIVATRRRTTVQ